jgi:hypothetical protein
MFGDLSPTTRYRLQYALAISVMTAALAALVTFLAVAFLFLAAAMHPGTAMPMMMPHLHGMPVLMPSGVLGSAAWLVTLAAYAGLMVGIPSFFLLYLGGAGAN